MDAGWRSGLLQGISVDLRLAVRRLVAAPLFTIFAIVSLGVAVGVTTAGYSVIESIFLRDPGIPDPARFVFVASPYDGRLERGSVSQPDFVDLRAAQRSFTGVSASSWFRPAVTLSSVTTRLDGEAVDGAYFATIGVAPTIGRVIQRADDVAAAHVVVLSHRLWSGRFAQDPSIVGRTLRISGQSFEVIGVAAASFDGARGRIPGTQLWIPLSTEAALLPPSSAPLVARANRRLQVFGRLADDATVASASAELTAIGGHLDAVYPPAGAAGPISSERRWRAKSAAAISEEDTLFRRVGFTLIALVSLVLVVACTNLANLVLARGATKRQDLAVRTAMGAPRWRLVREQCLESLLLAVAGAAASYAVFLGLRALLDVEFTVALPFGGSWTLAIQPAVNVQALGVAVASALMSVVVFGLEPALTLTRSLDVRGVLAASAGGASPLRGRRQQRLLRWQVAVSAGFFIVATMFVKFTVEEARHHSGVDLDRLAVASVDLQTQAWDDARVRRAIDRVMEEARANPAVDSVSASTTLPFGGPRLMRLTLSLPDTPARRDGDDRPSAALAATPSLFRTLGIPMVKGRAFDERDHDAAPPVVILSAFTARQVFGPTDPVGRSLSIQAPGTVARLATVIGVARDTDVRSLMLSGGPLVYLPLAQQAHYGPTVTLVVRSTDAAAALRALRDAVRRAEPDLAVDMAGTGRAVLSGPFVFLRAAGSAALALGALTLLMAMVGLFGMQSHDVGRRTREIGVRMSCGATAAHIRQMVLRDAVRPVLEGLVLGLTGGLAGRAIVRAYLDVDSAVIDPWMLLVVPLPLLFAALCACYLPARRASRVDPTEALRCQ